MAHQFGLMITKESLPKIVRAKHEEYKKALAELFEEHREDFYPKDYKLEFVHTTTIGFAEAWQETYRGALEYIVWRRVSSNLTKLFTRK